MRRRKKPSAQQREWRRVDLHLHTPASGDYMEPTVAYVDILRQAHARGLDMIAFTDHNTVAGYAAMQRELAHLEMLEQLQRLVPGERALLDEYRELLEQVLVLPGFEFTATFGFHILGIFSPETPLRNLEHVLLSLNVPSDQLDKGSSTVGATADVLQAYRLINGAGGLAIASHANSSNGVAMRSSGYGGQTRIAYTQDPSLHALEVTDFDVRTERTTARFFNGSKPEYPRRMHCIQGSDAHRLFRDADNSKHLGVGDRVTEVLLEEVSFEALKKLFLGTDFSQTRPYHGVGPGVDFLQSARTEGSSIVQEFHDKVSERGGFLNAIICDVGALANTNGGVIYLGVSRDPREKPVGIQQPEKMIEALHREIGRRITPELVCTLDTLMSQGKQVVRIAVPRAGDPPYAIDEHLIYVRDEAETSLAVRDEVVQLVLRQREAVAPPVAVPAAVASLSADQADAQPVVGSPEPVKAPGTGVEVLETEERDGIKYHVMRDLRNGNVVKNVTRSSARRLWHYAVTSCESDPQLERSQVVWQGDLGLVKKTTKGESARYDLCQRTPHGLRIYYGVNEDGIRGAWKQVVGVEE